MFIQSFRLQSSRTGEEQGREEEEEQGMWNKKSILWKLEYWQLLDVHHSIDTMHIKKNVCESMCGTLLQQRGKGKDHENVREDLKDMGIRPELYAEETDTGMVLSVVAAILSKTERKELCEFCMVWKFLQATHRTSGGQCQLRT